MGDFDDDLRFTAWISPAEGFRKPFQKPPLSLVEADFVLHDYACPKLE
jgi:hypothetical protein